MKNIKNRKKILYILLIAFFIIVGYTFINSIINHFEIQSVMDNKDEKAVPITYLVVDEKVPDNTEISDVVRKYQKNILFTANKSVVTLSKKNNYYEGKIKNVNKEILKKIINYSFTENNLNGVIIKNCKFDNKKFIVKVPVKYFSKSKKVNPIQMEIVSKVNSNKFSKLTAYKYISRFLNKKEKIELNGFDDTTVFSIQKYKKGKNILKKDIKIYINNIPYQINPNLYEYYGTAGTIKLNYPSMLINTIQVKISKKTFFSFLSNKVSAVTKKYENMNIAAELSSQPSLSVNDEFTIKDVPVAYDTITDGKYGSDSVIKNWDKADDSALYSGCNNNTCTSYEGSQDYFVADLASGTTNKISIKSNNAYIKLFCSEHTKSSSSASTMNLTLKVLAINNSDNYVIFQITGQNNFFTQIPSGVVKMTWNDRTGRLKAKKLLDGNPAANFKFQLYDGSDCTAGNEIRKIKTSNDNGIVVWKNLEFGDYSVKEVNCDSNTYTCDTTCRNRHLGKGDKSTDDDGDTAYIDNELVNKNPFINSTIVTPPSEYYGYVYKYDEETLNPIDGATIGVYSDNTCTTFVGYISSGNTGIPDYAGYALAWFSTYYNDGYYYAKEEIPPDGYTSNTNCIPIPVHEYPGNGQYPIIGNENGYNEALMPEKKIKYCIAVAKKDAVTGAFLNGASFEVKKGEETVAPADNLDFLGTTDDNGNLVSDGYGGWAAYGPFDKDTLLTITEIKPPEAYTINSSVKNVSAGVPATDGVCPNSLAAYENGTTSIAVFENEKDFINWYKVAEDGETKISGAEFVVREKGTDNYVYFDKNENKQKISTTDNNGVSKNCYLKKGLYNPDVSSSEDKLAAVSASKEEYVMISDTSGEVCLTGLDSNKEYEVIETKPGKYHTFGSSNTKSFISSPSLQPMSSDNKFINYPTIVTFKKLVTSGNTDALWNKVTTEELKRIPFQVYKKELNENGEIVYNQLIFIEKEDGTYHYANNELDGITGNRVSNLYIKDNNRNFTIYHLPVGEYILTENGQQSTSLEKCPCTNSNLLCSGFYTPGPIEFKVTECSGATATSGKNSSGESCNKNMVNIKMTNKPTEIEFTKKDFYGYEDSSDIVDFENDEERNDFDKIKFKIYTRNADGTKNYLSLVKVGNKNNCQTDSGYAEYRYIPDEVLNKLSESEKANLEIVTDLNTCGGHIKITHLCRGRKYYIEEVEVPEDSVFVLEKDKNGNNPTVEYSIPCCGDEEKTSTTQIIEDKGTRVRIEKRDSKYNYIIPDETTFELYRCKKGEECNPSDYSHVDSTTGKLVIDKEAVKNAGMKQIKFAPRAVLTKDEEDPTDAEGLVGVEVYNAMSDNDIKSGKTSVTELHTYHGILVLRYLQSGYNYVLVETVAPKNYMLPIGRDTQTRLTVVNNTVDVESVDMPNKPTSLLIRKYSNDGKLLPGAEFKIYETTEKDSEGKYKCNSNLSAKNQNKKEMKFKVIRDGVYEYKPELTDSIVKTCNDVNGVCSGIPQNPSTQLTYDTYKNTWADFANTTTSDGKTIEIQQGEALIQYLEYGHCYVIEETKAPEGYSLPSKEEERYTMVYIDENDSYYHDTETTLINKPTPFTFYKYDEFNKLIDGGEFKLQRLNSEKKYEDVAVELYEESEDGKLYYKVVEEGLNYTMRTYNGSATVYFLKQGQYRIVETKAPEGKELSKNPNIATFFVDNKGNVYGNSLIVNKGKTEKIDVKPSASAMLIVNIQTGQVVIRYGLIISFLVASIAGLMLYLRKKNRG